MTRALALAVLLVAATGHAQEVILTVPPPYVTGQSERQGDRDYGTPQVSDLDSVTFAPRDGAHVIVLGILDVLAPGQYWSLRDGNARVLLVPGEGMGSEVDALLGARIEIRGVVRKIRPKEYVGPQRIDRDLIEHPSLPVLPAPRSDWPPVSITVLALTDRSSADTSRPRAPTGAAVGDVARDPARYAGQKVRLLGQFRGRNLFSDLPAESQRGRSDWVLKHEDAAVWVTGKDPRGKGFALDLDYRGDTARWLVVEGKAEVAKGVVYLRASKVMLAAPPRPPTEDDESPP